MVDYIGKICPFCKTEIKEDDEVKVCPSCGIPHHKACWEENKGCTTFGCSEQHYEEQHTNPTDICVKCGAPLGDGQAFCPKCGTPKGGDKKKICSKCGAELEEGQEFCPKCGQKVGLTLDNGVQSAISQFNSSVEKKKKNNKVLPIVLTIIAVLALVVGYFVVKAVKANNIEKAEKEYLATAKEFAAYSVTAGANLEDIADTVQSYWYDAIWKDKYNDDINTAILYAMIDKSEEIKTAETQKAHMDDLYSRLKKLPDGVDNDDLKDVRDAVKDLYNIYTDFYSLATDPSGNYNSFSEANNSKTDTFLTRYRALNNLLD